MGFRVRRPADSNKTLTEILHRRDQLLHYHAYSESKGRNEVTPSMGRGFLSWAWAVALAASLSTRAAAPPAVEDGFRLLYETRFQEARSRFLVWEKVNPEDPLGHAWEAASYLFEEFYQQG